VISYEVSVARSLIKQVGKKEKNKVKTGDNITGPSAQNDKSIRIEKFDKKQAFVDGH
jgi:hypothetical protein